MPISPRITPGSQPSSQTFFFPGLASDSVDECVLVASEKILEWKPPEHTLIAEIVQSSVNSCFFP